MITETQKRESCILINKIKILINEAIALINTKDLRISDKETDFYKSISDSISETKEKLVEARTKRNEKIEQTIETLKEDIKDAISSASEGFGSGGGNSSSSSSGNAANGVDAETIKSVFGEVATGIDEAISKNNDSIKTVLEDVNTDIEDFIDETLPSTFDKFSKLWYETKRDLIIDEINKTLNELSTQIQNNI